MVCIRKIIEIERSIEKYSKLGILEFFFIITSSVSQTWRRVRKLLSPRLFNEFENRRGRIKRWERERRERSGKRSSRTSTVGTAVEQEQGDEEGQRCIVECTLVT